MEAHEEEAMVLPQERRAMSSIEPQPPPSPNRRVVLMVDDHSWIRKIVEQALGGEYVVKTAQDGREALKFLRLIKIDLLITDLVMPEMGGLALAQEVRTHFPSLPIVFVSAHLDPDMLAQARALSPYYVTKPFGVEELQKKIRRVMEASVG